VRESAATVLRWFKRCLGEDTQGLSDAPKPGRPETISEGYRQQLLETVRRRRRSLDQPYSRWTLQRLSDYIAEQTGIRVTDETVHHILHRGDIVLSRPRHKIISPDSEYELKKRRLKKGATV